MRSGRLLSASLLVALLLLAGAVHATLSVTTSRNDYVGTGALATYSYTFRITASSDLRVTKRTTAGVETTLVLTTDYTVTGVGVGSGGTITLTAGNLPSGYALTIRRVLPLTQPTDLRNQGPFLAETHETVFDRLTMQSQQQQDELSRSIRVPESISPSAFSTLLPATVTASGGQALIVKTDGTGIDTVPVNPGSIFTSPAITGTVTGGASYEGIVPGLYSNTAAGLEAAFPAASGADGRLAWVTDGIRGIWKDTGTAWVSVTGVLNLRDAVTGGSGTRADPWTGDFQAAIDGVGVTHVVAPGGAYLFTSEFTVPSNVTVAGLGRWDSVSYELGTIFIGRHTGRSVVSLVGKNYVNLENIIIEGDATTIPQTGLLMGRTTSASAGQHHTKDIVVKGSFSKAGIYSIASEQNVHDHPVIQITGGAALHAFYTSQSDGLSVGGLTGSSNIQMSVTGFWFSHEVASVVGSALTISAGASTAALAFRDGYLTKQSLGQYIDIEVGVVDGQGSSGPIIFDNVDGEAIGAGPTYGIYAHGNNEAVLKNLRIEGGRLNAGTHFIYIPPTNVSSPDNRIALDGAVITGIAPLDPSAFWNVSRSIMVFPAQNVTIAGTSTDNLIIHNATLSVTGADRSFVLKEGAVTLARVKAAGTALVAGDVALSAGWGTTASVSAISGADQRMRFTITSGGTGQGANPTATLTFKDGTWTAAPFAVCSRNGGNQAAVLPTWTTTATTLVLTFPGTPIAAEAYTSECLVMG